MTSGIRHQASRVRKKREVRSRKPLAKAGMGFLLSAFCLMLIGTTPLHAQITGEMEDESRLYAESKQVNQFFRRFNGEEDEKGNRYYPGDKQYRGDKLR